MLKPPKMSFYKYAAGERADEDYIQQALTTLEKLRAETDNTKLVEECDRTLEDLPRKSVLEYNRVDKIFELCGVSVLDSLKLCNIERPVPFEHWEEAVAALNRLDMAQFDTLYSYEQKFIQPWFYDRKVEEMQPSQRVWLYAKNYCKYRPTPEPRNDRQKALLDELLHWRVAVGLRTLSLQSICDICEMFHLPLRWAMKLPPHRVLYTSSAIHEKIMDRFLLMTPRGQEIVLDAITTYQNR